MSLQISARVFNSVEDVDRLLRVLGIMGPVLGTMGPVLGIMGPVLGIMGPVLGTMGRMG
jgi:hypothetical protein